MLQRTQPIQIEMDEVKQEMEHKDTVLLSAHTTKTQKTVNADWLNKKLTNKNHLELLADLPPKLTQKIYC